MTNWDGVEDIFDELDGEETLEESEETTDVTLDELDGDAEEIEEVKEVTLDDLDEETEEVADTERLTVLKATTEYLASKYELDISEVDITDEDSFGNFVDDLVDLRVQEKYDEGKNSNPLVQALLTVTENGGDTADVLALFQQQKELADIDTSTIEGKVEKIRKYYKDIEGKPSAWIEKYIKKLSVGDDTSDIEEEFNTVSKEYDNFFEEEKEAKVKQAVEFRQQKEARIKKQVSDFTTVLDNKKFKKQESQELVDFVFSERFKLKDSDQVLSKFDVEILKAKNKPEDLAELVLFLKNKDEYKKKIVTEFNNEKNESKFSSILKKQQVTNNTESIKPTKLQFKLP